MTDAEINALAFETATTYNHRHVGDFGALVMLIELAIITAVRREIADVTTRVASLQRDPERTD